MNVNECKPVRVTIRICPSVPLPLYVADVLRRYCGMLVLSREMGLLSKAELRRLLAEVDGYLGENSSI